MLTRIVGLFAIFFALIGCFALGAAAIVAVGTMVLRGVGWCG
jgi:hypothetical protein